MFYLNDSPSRLKATALSPDSVDELIGKNIYFGEIMGKHSDICGEAEQDDFTIISTDNNFVKQFEELIGSTGHNPFDYSE